MNDKIMLHLGCWKRYIPGFIHIDLCDMPHIDYKTNIDDLSMFYDETVDLIYSSHSIEYFDRTEVVKVLTEWNRVLKKGGILRIAVPDLEKLILIYEKYKDLNKILGPLYGRMEIDTEEGNKFLYHKTVYDYNSLQTLLQENGFNNVRRYDWRETIHKDYDDHSQAYIPHMDKENGVLISLNVEANKI